MLGGVPNWISEREGNANRVEEIESVEKEKGGGDSEGGDDRNNRKANREEQTGKNGTVEG